jgi:hypothetical protein
MLAGMADVVFLVDNSDSDNHVTKDWLKAIIDDLDSSLRTAAIDVRYGLVAFGEQYQDLSHRFAHSEVVDTDSTKSVFNRLFSNGTSGADHRSDLHASLDHLINVEIGGYEDGWDAIDHAIAEYEFRDGAVPVFVLVQNDEGRINLNTTLTHEGILAGLRSKNVIVNSLVVGAEIGSTGVHEPLFDLSPYEVSPGAFTNRQVLGVEGDATDNGADGQHNYYLVETGTAQTIAPDATKPMTQADALQLSFNGSNTGASGMVGSGKSVLIAQNVTGGTPATNAGYRAKSVPFAFEDLINRTTGNPVPGATRIESASDNILLSDQALGAFQFNFFGVRNEVRISSDGIITFVDSFNYSTIENRDLSQVGGLSGQPLIAALWDSMVDVDGPESAFVWQVKESGLADERLVIQWEQMAYTGDNTSGGIDPVTFQAVLYRDGRIGFNYLDLESFPHGDFDSTVDKTGGVSSTVGIWSGAADPLGMPPGKYIPGPHSINGESITDSFGETNDSYVRLAWDSGGAAWDLGTVDAFFSNGGIDSPEANALRDKFIASLANQINSAADKGKVFRDDEVVLAINYGGDALPASQGGFAEDTGDTASSRWTTATSINTSSNSIPLFGSPAAKAQQVFQSARTGDTTNGVNDDIQLAFPALANGAYVVELYFAEISNIVSTVGARDFDVVLEGQTVLNDYDIFADHARIVAFGASTTELDVSELGGLTTQGGPGGIVKRFRVDVSDADGAAGLQIGLVAQTGDALINGVRILRADAPRIENVVVKGSSWSDGVDYSYAEAVAGGNQLRPIYLQNANRIEVHFDGPVDLASAELDILGDNRAVIKSTAGGSPTITFAGYNATSFVGTWNLNSPFGAGKYAL